MAWGIEAGNIIKDTMEAKSYTMIREENEQYYKKQHNKKNQEMCK
jgi:hypothetical protein